MYVSRQIPYRNKVLVYMNEDSNDTTNVYARYELHHKKNLYIYNMQPVKAYM